MNTNQDPLLGRAAASLSFVRIRRHAWRHLLKLFSLQFALSAENDLTATTGSALSALLTAVLL